MNKWAVSVLTCMRANNHGYKDLKQYLDFWAVWIKKSFLASVKFMIFFSEYLSAMKGQYNNILFSALPSGFTLPEPFSSPSKLSVQTTVSTQWIYIYRYMMLVGWLSLNLLLTEWYNCYQTCLNQILLSKFSYTSQYYTWNAMET